MTPSQPKPEPVKDEMPLGHKFAEVDLGYGPEPKCHLLVGRKRCMKLKSAHQQAQKDGEE